MIFSVNDDNFFFFLQILQLCRQKVNIQWKYTVETRYSAISRRHRIDIAMLVGRRSAIVKRQFFAVKIGTVRFATLLSPTYTYEICGFRTAKINQHRLNVFIIIILIC